MNTGQFYGRTKKTLPHNRITVVIVIVQSEESNDDMVGSSVDIVSNMICKNNGHIN